MLAIVPTQIKFPDLVGSQVPYLDLLCIDAGIEGLEDIAIDPGIGDAGMPAEKYPAFVSSVINDEITVLGLSYVKLEKIKIFLLFLEGWLSIKPFEACFKA
jgi:hypothetical protein